MICAIDFESYYDNDLSVSTMGAWHYARATDIYLVSMASDTGLRFVGHPKDAPWGQVDGQVWLMHNAAFDLTLTECLIEKGVIPRVKPAAVHDTADMTAYLGYPRSLKEASHFLLGTEVSKDVRDKMKKKQWATMTPEFQEDVCKYALGDAENTLNLWLKHGDKWPEHERTVSRLTRKMTMRGVPVNTEKLHESSKILTETASNTRDLLPWHPSRPALSLHAVRDQCAAEGIWAPDSFAEKEEQAQKWEDEFADKFAWVKAMREHRKANKHLKTIQAMLTRTRPNGRMGYDLKYFGATTGRDSGSGGWNCMTGDHEVLTPDGCVAIETWNPKHPIMQFNEDATLEFCEAEKVELYHRGQLIEIDGPRVRGLFTPNHRIVYHRRGKIFEIPAETLLTKDQNHIPTAGGFIHAKSSLTDNELCLLVALAADGHVTPKGQITFGFRKQRKIERLNEILGTIPFHSKVRPDGVTTFTITKCDVPQWLTKGISDWVMTLSPDQAEVVIEELSKWDGEKNPRSGQVTFFTAKQEEALWAATLGHLHNIACSTNYYARTDGMKGRYIVYFTRGRTTRVRNGSGTISVRPQPYQGKVYCAKVPSGAFLIRYRDRIHVTGNCQNLPRDVVSGVDIRSLIEAPAGKMLVVCDLSQIEARCILYLAKDQATLDVLRTGVDVYEAHARATMGYTDPRPLKDVDKALRQLAKARVLGLGFGCGANKFQVVAKMMAGLEISPSEADRIVTEYRASNPKIVGLWRKLDEALRKSQGTHLIVALPSKRTLVYRDVKAGYESSGVIPRNGKMLRSKLYGGLLAENLTQAFARDIFMDRVSVLAGKGYEVILRVHDEAVCLVDEATAEEARKDIETIMSTPPEWCKQLPMGAEATVMRYYAK